MPQEHDGASGGLHAGAWTGAPESLLTADISANAVRVALVIQLHARPGGRAPFPSQARVAEMCRMTTRTVKRAIAELRDAGFLKVVRMRRKDGSLGGNEYHLSIAGPGDTGGTRPGDTGVPSPGDTDVPSEVDVDLLSRGTSLANAREVRAPAKKRARNLPFDALVAACPGTDPNVDGSMVAKSLRTIRQRLASEAEVEHDQRGDRARLILQLDAENPSGNAMLAEQIGWRAQLYRERWPDVELTPTALAKNWTLVATARPGGKMTAREIAVMFDDVE